MRKTFMLLSAIGILFSFCIQPMAAEAEPQYLYRGEAVTELYSLDYEKRTYQRVTEDADITAALDALEDYIPEKVSPKSREQQRGFLIFTDKGKYPVYLPDEGKKEQTRELYALSGAYNGKYPRHIQWLVYMSTENIESVTFGGFGGKGYTHEDYRETYSIDAQITNPESIEKISRFLKEMVVTPESDVSYERSNPGTPAGVFDLRIDFKNGIHYYCSGPFFSIYSSDMPEQITYREDDKLEQTTSLRDLMMELPQSRLVWMKDW